MGQKHDERGGSAGTKPILTLNAYHTREVMDAEQLYNRTLNRLKASVNSTICKEFLRDCTELQRISIFTTVASERIERKSRDIENIYEQLSYRNWNTTLFILFMRTLGDVANREQFTTLACRVGHNPILRERGSLFSIEAMLLGTSGLLSRCPTDTYIHRLIQEYLHISHKYSIQSMCPSEWNLSRIKPYNHPILRIAQAASFLCKHEFICNEVLACRSVGDIEDIFNTEASEYWESHFMPRHNGAPNPKRIGRSKSHLLGINMVAPFIHTYNKCNARELHNEGAIALLESIPSEDNRYVAEWVNHGVHIDNALASQAVLQLSTEYCDKKQCERCPVAKMLISLILEGKRCPIE